MSKAGAHLVGIQEARTPEGSRVADDYYIVSSGAGSEGLGVELWVNTKVPYATKGRKQYFFAGAHVRALYRSQRILCARIDHIRSHPP